MIYISHGNWNSVDRFNLSVDDTMFNATRRAAGRRHRAGVARFHRSFWWSPTGAATFREERFS